LTLWSNPSAASAAAYASNIARRIRSRSLSSQRPRARYEPLSPPPSGRIKVGPASCNIRGALVRLDEVAGPLPNPPPEGEEKRTRFTSLQVDQQPLAALRRRGPANRSMLQTARRPDGRTFRCRRWCGRRAVRLA